MDGSLWDHLHEIDQSCQERLDHIVTQMAAPQETSQEDDENFDAAMDFINSL